MLADSDIQVLVPGLIRGDEKAYRTLVRRLAGPLVAYAMVITGDQASAQDVTQDAFLRIYRIRRRLDGRARLRGLCFRMVRNLARNLRRDTARRLAREQEAAMENARVTGTPELALLAWEKATLLAPDLREVLELRFRHGLGREEIASVLEIPEGTVATRQRTALEKLREQLAPMASVPALGAVNLPEMLEGAAPSSLIPDVVPKMEELVMSGIRSLKLKAAFTLAASLLLVLLTGVVGTVAVVNAAAAEPTAHTPAASVSAAAVPRSAVAHDTPAAHDSAASGAPPAAAMNAMATETHEASATPFAGEARALDPGPDAAAHTAAPSPAQAPHAQPQPAAAARPLPPAFLEAPPKLAIAEQAFQWKVMLAGSPAPKLTATGLPAWLKLNDNQLQGTPERKDAGPGPTIVLRADNGVQPRAELRFELFVASAPRITSTPGSVALAGQLFQHEIRAEGEPKPTFSVAGAPAWLTLNGSSLSGTPTVDDAGKTGTITVTADNGIAPRATQDFMLDVQAAPSITSIALVQIKAGVAYRYEVAMKGLPAPTLKATGLPKWLKLEGNVLAGTPHNADIGKSRRITLQASNGLKPDATQAFQIEVVANPDYLEMPWTLEELRAYWKPGLEWVVLGEMTVATGKAIRDRNPHKVLSVKGDLVEIEVINYFYKAGINGADVEEIKTTGTLDLGALAKGELFPGQSKVKYVGVENTDIAGKRLSCSVFEVEFIQEYTDKAGKQQQLTQVYRLHYIVGKPGLCAKQEQIQSGKPDNPHEATEIKEPKQPK